MFEHLIDIRAARDQRVDRIDNRHVDVLVAGEAGEHRGGECPFGDGAAVGEQLGGGAALTKPRPSE